MPNLLVAEIGQAIKQSRALKVYVCNVATQPGETDGYALSDHIKGLLSHVGPGLFDYVLANNRYMYYKPEWNQVGVQIDDAARNLNVTIVPADVVEESFPTRHNPTKLAQALLDLYGQRSKS
jgi:uncharacterized cofD-like protein